MFHEHVSLMSLKTVVLNSEVFIELSLATTYIVSIETTNLVY